MQNHTLKISGHAGSQSVGFLNLLIVVHCLAVFFMDILHIMTLLELVSLVLMGIYYFTYRKKLHVPRFMILWICYIGVVFADVFLGADYNFVISFAIFSAISLGLIGVTDAGLYLIKTVRVCTLIHLTASVLVYVLPQGIVNPVCSALLGSNASLNYWWRVYSGHNPGITSQPAVNAVYLTTGLMLCHGAVMFRKEKRLFNIILEILFLGMLMTTGKRGCAMFAPIAIVICTMYLKLGKKRHMSRNMMIGLSLSAAVICGAALYGAYRSGILTFILEKTRSLSDSGDVSNGRFELWSMALTAFREHPFIGIGLKQFGYQYGLDVHNSYLQILTELGMIGMIAFLLGLLLIARFMCRRLKMLRRESSLHKTSEACAAQFTGVLLFTFLVLYALVSTTFSDYITMPLFYMSTILAYTGGKIALSQDEKEIQKLDFPTASEFSRKI